MYIYIIYMCVFVFLIPRTSDVFVFGLYIVCLNGAAPLLLCKGGAQKRKGGARGYTGNMRGTRGEHHHYPTTAPSG